MIDHAFLAVKMGIGFWVLEDGRCGDAGVTRKPVNL